MSEKLLEMQHRMLLPVQEAIILHTLEHQGVMLVQFE